MSDGNRADLCRAAERYLSWRLPSPPAGYKWVVDQIIEDDSGRWAIKQYRLVQEAGE